VRAEIDADDSVMYKLVSGDFLAAAEKLRAKKIFKPPRLHGSVIHKDLAHNEFVLILKRHIVDAHCIQWVTSRFDIIRALHQ